MVDDDSDYELMPKKEVERLKKEISALKKNPYGESDRGQELQKSIDRLNNTMNKLIAILEDAQQDIIDEYNESKPIEKLNQILDQNETIAKALVSIHDKLSNDSTDSSGEVSHDPNALPIPDNTPIIVQGPQIPRPGSQFSQQSVQQTSSLPQFNPQPFQQPVQQSFNPQPFQQPVQQQPMQQFAQQRLQQKIQPQQFQKQQTNQIPDFAPLPPLDSIDSLPPLEGLDTKQMDTGMLPEQKKKKFLGIIG